MDIENDLIPEDTYAELTNRHVRSVQRERATRTGPAFIKIGRRIYYRRGAVEKWLLDREQVQPRANGGPK